MRIYRSPSPGYIWHAYSCRNFPKSAIDGFDISDVAFWVFLNHPRFARRYAGRNNDGPSELISQSFNSIIIYSQLRLKKLSTESHYSDTPLSRRDLLIRLSFPSVRRRERLRDHSHGRVCWRIPRKDSASGDRAEIQDVDMPPRVAAARSCGCGRTAIGIAD